MAFPVPSSELRNDDSTCGQPFSLTVNFFSATCGVRPRFRIYILLFSFIISLQGHWEIKISGLEPFLQTVHAVHVGLVIRANFEWETRKARAAGITARADNMLPVYHWRWASFHT